MENTTGIWLFRDTNDNAVFGIHEKEDEDCREPRIAETRSRETAERMWLAGYNICELPF